MIYVSESKQTKTKLIVLQEHLKHGIASISGKTQYLLVTNAALKNFFEYNKGTEFLDLGGSFFNRIVSIHKQSSTHPGFPLIWGASWSHSYCLSIKKGTMAEVEVANNLEEFISSGRTGRRNAMADILDSKHASTSTAGIDLDMSGLKCSEDNKSQNDQSNSPGSSDSNGS
ncbi:uncharacterized protein LOC111133130 [Crassostrea virginica]